MINKKKAFEKYIFDICDALRAHFFMQEYTIFYEFDYDTMAFGESEEIAAQIDVDNVYLRYKIITRGALFDMYTKKRHEDIIETLIHEHCHALTDPLYKMAVDCQTNNTLKYLEDANERQTQRITNIIFSNIPKKWINKQKIRDPKKKVAHKKPSKALKKKK